MTDASKFRVKFRTEYICLNCGYVTDRACEKCPKCGRPMCPRIIRVRR